MGSRMSRWDLINSEILLICLRTRRKKSVGLYKGISLYNLIKAGFSIQLGARYETDMFDTSLSQAPRIKITLSYHIELKYAINMNSAVIYHQAPAKIHYLINILYRKRSHNSCGGSWGWKDKINLLGTRLSNFSEIIYRMLRRAPLWLAFPQSRSHNHTPQVPKPGNRSKNLRIRGLSPSLSLLPSVWHQQVKLSNPKYPNF